MTLTTTPTFPASARYRLSRCVARGGMGAVYLGYQKGAAGFERRVAIKRAVGSADLSMRHAILEEARISSFVRHPNVVSVDDVEEIGEELFLVMDYVEGGSLAQIQAAGAFVSPRVAIRIVLDVCEGLGAIHEAHDREGHPLRLVHRDVSPQNILIGSEGVSRISDFGIAKSQHDPRKTSSDLRRGKIGYMAPEYLRFGATHANADMFALGVVLWELLAGTRLFKSGARDLNPDAPAFVPPSLTEHGVSSALDDVVKRALAEDPTERFPSMRAFAEAVAAATTDIASHAEVADLVKQSMPALEAARPDAAAVAIPEEPAADSCPPTRREPSASGHHAAAAAPEAAPAVDAVSVDPRPSPRHARFEVPETAATVRATPVRLPDEAFRTMRSRRLDIDEKSLRNRVTVVPPLRRKRMRKKRTLTALAVTLVVTAVSSVAYVGLADPPRTEQSASP